MAQACHPHLTTQAVLRSRRLGGLLPEPAARVPEFREHLIDAIAVPHPRRGGNPGPLAPGYAHNLAVTVGRVALNSGSAPGVRHRGDVLLPATDFELRRRVPPDGRGAPRIAYDESGLVEDQSDSQATH